MNSGPRRAIVFDGERWYVRRIRVIEHDLDRDEKVYRCEKPIGNDFAALADVPEVKKLTKDIQNSVIDLHSAFQELINLSDHYAKLLNMHDGGERRTRSVHPVPVCAAARAFRRRWRRDR